MSQMKSGLLRANTIDNQARNQIDKEVENAAMAGVFDLRNVLELVIDGFNNRAFPKQHFILRMTSADSACFYEQK